MAIWLSGVGRPVLKFCLPCNTLILPVCLLGEFGNGMGKKNSGSSHTHPPCPIPQQVTGLDERVRRFSVHPSNVSER